MLKLIDLAEQAQLDEHKKPRLFSEDCYLLTPRLVAVADGITSKANRRLMGSYSSDPEWLVHSFLGHLEDIAAARTESRLDDAKEVLHQAISATIKQFERDRIVFDGIGKYEYPACSFCMAMQHIEDPGKITLVNVGGNMIFSKDKVVKGSETLQKLDAELFSQMRDKISKGIKANDRAYIRHLRQIVSSVNTPASYPTVNPTLEWLTHAETLIETVEMNIGDKIILTTDGLTRLIDFFNVYSEEHFYEGCISEGLPLLLKRLRELEIDDWEISKYPRWQATYDVCAVAVEIT